MCPEVISDGSGDAASFQGKVEALRRLRERRRAREKAAEREAVPLEDPIAASPVVGPGEGRSQPEVHVEAKAGLIGSQAPPRATPQAKPDPGGPGGEGETDALFCAGHCHERGLHGCSEDFAMAAECYELAAERGHVAAQWRLGELYERGHGVEQSDAEAVKWYRLAAEAGNTQAQAALALFLEDGRGLDRDCEEALRWHLVAAEKGHAVSQYCAANLLVSSDPPDTEQAGLWLRRSAEAGFQPAQRALARVGLAPGQQLEAEETVETDGSLVDLAARVAHHLGDLDDGDAEDLLDDLLTDLPLLLDDADQR